MAGYTPLQPNLPIRRGPGFYTLPRKYDEPVGQVYTHLTKKQRIMNELKAVDVSWYGLVKSEISMLPQLIHDDEHIMGVVYGHHKGSSAMLIATDHRVLYIDRKPMFVNTDELTYDIVGGIAFGKVGLRSSVVLHTRTGDYAFTTMNFKAAKHFIDYIESRCLDQIESFGQKKSLY